jgi:wobble nucleotide-excising tRNase
MLKTLSNFKLKSWKDESNLSSVEFNQVNIVFGHNGAGKSSLATGIYKEYTATGEPKGSSRIFGSKYVDTTLMLEDKKGIRGVISNFGIPDLEIEKKITKNNNRIQEITNENKNNADELKKIIDSTETLIKDTVTRRKENNRKINNKPSEKTSEEKVKLWIDDYDKAFKDFPDEDYNKITGGIDYTAENEQVSNLVLHDLLSYEENLVAEMSAVLEKPYPKVEIPNSEIINWLQAGLHIHEGKRTCEYCGNSFDTEAVKSKVMAFVNDERHKAITQLENYSATFNSITDAATIILGNKETYISLLGLNNDDFIELDKALNDIGDFVKGELNEKMKDMSQERTAPKDFDKSIGSINVLINKLNVSKSKRSKEITEKINRLEVLVKGAIGFEIKNSAAISDNITKIDDLNKSTRLLDTEKNKLIDANTLLASKKSDLADFAAYLNGVLVDLNLNFKLEIEDEYYLLKHTDKSTLKVSDISDGERNLLALIYFYYEMLGDSSGTFKDSIKLIVIDDPISSLDDGNKFYITELIRTILNQNSAQVFVFTHSWDDFCNITYGQSGDNISLFEIKKVAGVSNIHLISNKKLLKPYIMLYREVDSFQQKGVADISDDDALHMPNILRRILEEYVKFRVDVDFATAGKNGDISKALFSEEISKISNTKKQKLNQLLTVCNVLSHKANQPKNPSEIHESAKFLIGSIEQHDKFHHLKMRGD